MKLTVRTKIFNILLGTFLAMALGCTKERPYEYIPTDLTKSVKDEPKNLIDTEAEYLYVPSSLNSSRTTDATFPMYMGEAKIVRLQLAESALKVIAVDDEERFSGNPINNRPVLSIPIEHIDYQCAKDADGKCTNKQEQDVGKPWAKRKYIKLRSSELAVQEINFLPVEIKNLFQPCYNEIASDFVGYKLEADAINIQVEKTFMSSIQCASNVEFLSDLTFKVVYHYSLVKLDKITSPNYKSLSYSRKEESTFGFFDTDTLKLDRDNNKIDANKKKFLNRWNPTKTVVYNLTQNFNKPENAKIKAATISGVARINKSLALAGADLRIDLQEAIPGMSPGDLRVNSIVMVEEPVNYGILGYGPTAANPRSGEIVHGRAAMYLGVIKTGIRRAYEEVVLEKLQNSINSKITLAPELVNFERPAMKLTPREFKTILDSTDAISVPPPQSSTKAQAGASGSHGSGTSHSHIEIPANMEQLKAYATRTTERRVTLQDAIMHQEDESIREQIISTHCFYDISNFDMHETLEKEIEKLIEELGAKKWTELTDSEKDKVIDILIPFVWVPTLIHEIGHTLGLRHNFAGSEDSANYYSKEELAQMGITREFKYSSVMDYGYRSTNELQVMGKYDIAALRYGYAEKIMLEDNNTLVPISRFRDESGLKIKAFKYCTDEHVAVNPNCNRFDEGTTLVEQAEHWMKMYEDSYARRNFRNGAASFSLYDDATQIRRVGLVMNSLRTMFERYEDIKKTYGLADDSPAWGQYDFLKDLKMSTQMAGNFFMSVLETPDTLCAAAQANNPALIIGVVPLKLLSPNAISCLDKENVQLNPGYVIVGQAGKSFQSRKDPNSSNPYIDQVDVRGIWIDKLLAAKALTGRLIGIESFDEYTDNFLDLSDMRTDLQTRLSALMLDETITRVPIHTISGDVLVANIAVQLFNAAENLNGHKILKPLHPGVQKYFGIPSNGIDFQVKLVDMLKSALPSHEQARDSTSLLNSIVVANSLSIGIDVTQYIKTDIGLQSYYINLKSDVAATDVMFGEMVKLFSALGEETLTKILTDIAAGTPPPVNATPEEKLARALGPEAITKFLIGGFQDVTFYEKMLQAMAL